MIRKPTVPALAAGLLLAALPAFAASDYLLEIDGIHGEAPAKKSIDVHAFSWGATNAGSLASAPASSGKVSVQDLSVTKAPRDAASGMPSGRRAAVADVSGDGRADVAVASRELTVTLPESAAKSMCATGKHIAKATLSGRGQRAELTDVVVTSCSTQAGVSTVSMRGHTKSGHVTLLK